MKATGIVVEYNPFHNGHQLHLKKARELTNPDVVIAVMSGSFVQRGDPAILPKWERTKMALAAGVDIVVELPVAFSTQHATIFAEESVRILDALHINSLFFGSEHGDANDFSEAANKVANNEATFNQMIKHSLENKKISYAKAYTLALETLLGEKKLDVTKPNNILGFHYALAVQKQNPTIKLQSIAREQAQYHDEQATHTSIASATAIRKMMLAGESKQAMRYLPISSQEILRAYSGPFLSWDDYWPFLKFRLLQATSEELKAIRGVSEGIQNRMQLVATTAENFFEFIEQTKTKRYSNARLQRTALQILLNAKDTKSKPYIRILGMSKLGQQYLALHKKNIPLQVVTTASKASSGILTEDLKATTIYTLAKGLESYQKGDFQIPPIITL
ncbi:nucleotidyltransferase [Listeria seeligeri]|uniref:nucleotidyltransferase n=1 Tax=Listeria seeligeri TaxID=1640 RepID=UPI001629EDD1|nr:nucleotidyltransferase [Listeria seeligeri]MBC1442284.1 nucleotidyltransferase [Listeria seeligeri]MBC1540237.1 nucleotidyltransferase [Listeria seeligeri]MBC1772210.1 nucleotidyltransferase [Listeria seeligeri]MBC1864974.1 nucleotidyltransferase [Listeria seeligeri]MBC1879366.1 nucleotidyltransferase [Listeria seeligeri]